MNEDGTLSFGTAIDVSGYDKGIDHITEKTAELGANVENKSSKIAQLLANVPTIDINVTTNAAQSLSTIDAAFAEIDRVVDSNKAGIRELEEEYKRLGAAANKSAQKGDSEQTQAYREEQKAIEQVIAARKKAITEAEKTSDELLKTEQGLKNEAAAAEQAANAHTSLRTKIRALKEEMADMVANGVSQQSAAYKELVNELGRLTDLQGDIQQQGSVLANDEAKIAGVISGLNGLAGGFTAAQGAVSLFVGENEDLNRIMLKVQSLMAITMGLQQVQQTLNKDSAFSLVTLNGLKQWWNELLAVGAGLETADAAATEVNTASNTANAVASGAEAAAKAAASTASGEKAVTEGVDTAATGANAVAAGAGTVANIGLAGAFRMVGAAISSIPVFGWIAAAIGVLIGVISHFVSEANEADKEMEEHEKLMEDGRKAYAQASAEISSYSQKIESFNGTKKQEKKIIEELNQKYGSSLGYYDSLAKWKDVLRTKGEAYCEMLLKEAEAQAILNKYTEAYLNVQEVKDKAANGDYHHWYNTASGDRKEDEEQIAKAEKSMNNYLSMYKSKMAEADKLKSQFNIGGFTQTSKKSGKTDSNSTFDPKKAALDTKNAIEQWKEEVKKYIKDANSQVSKYTIDTMADGQAKEINQIALNTFEQAQSWKDKLKQLAEIRKNSYKDVYMAQNGATEVGWSESKRGKMSTEDYESELLQDPQIYKEYNNVKTQIEEQGQQQIAAVRKKYTDAYIDEYGTTEQKIEKLEREWMDKMATIPSEYIGNATQQMNEEFSKLATEDFKKSIDWESVFGNLDNQSLSSLQTSLNKVKTYFTQSKNDMSGDEIKDFQEAITKMEDEIASRNPFTALHKAFKDISQSKTELVAAMQAWKAATDEVTAAQNEYNEAKSAELVLDSQILMGTLSKDSEEYKNAIDNVKESKVKLNTATQNENKTENNTLKAKNNVTSSYKKFATQLNNVGGTIKDIGDKAKNLASIFDDDVADSIGKSIDFITDILDAASTVIDAISDTGKAASEGISTTVKSASDGAKASATAGATAIGTIEKASVILAVISAALQVATAIANLFNNDDKKQKEIENLQNRIDQLQWELDNADSVRLQNKVGDAVTKLKDIYSETTEEVLNLHLTTQQSTSAWTRYFARGKYSSEIYEKSIEKLADAYAKVDYTADKALGAEKYDNARSQLENLAEQQILVQKQINAEESKKDTDNSKIEDYKKQIQELAEEMATVINDMMEDIIGSSAEDIASQLGDAFIEACKSGENAMEAWKTKANEIIQDVLKKMLVKKFIEEPIGEIFDKYKKKWFGDDGTFNGIDIVIESMTGFSDDLNSVGETFNTVFSSLPDDIKSIFTDEAERDGTSKGIATASQDSVDENNARLTTIQGHTYTLVQGINELNNTSNMMLERLTGIENNTSQTNTKLDDMHTQVKSIKITVDDISMKGLKIKN